MWQLFKNIYIHYVPCVLQFIWQTSEKQDGFSLAQPMMPRRGTSNWVRFIDSHIEASKSSSQACEIDWIHLTRVAEVAQEQGWQPPKSLDSDGNFKPEHMLFCHELIFVAIYALFGDLWAKKCLFGSKTVFLGQEVHYYMVYIAYFTELILQICDYAQKRRICCENCKYVLDVNFHGHFFPDERLPSSATLHKTRFCPD